MLLASISFGQAPSSVPEIKTAQTTQIIKIDGEIEETEWQGAFVQDGLFDPVTGQGARNRTKVFLTYNQEALFVAFRCYALEPSDIIARSKFGSGQSLKAKTSLDLRSIHLEPAAVPARATSL